VNSPLEGEVLLEMLLFRLFLFVLLCFGNKNQRNGWFGGFGFIRVPPLKNKRTPFHKEIPYESKPPIPKPPVHPFFRL